MIYIDTSAIVKLYIREPDSQDVSKWLTKNNEPVPMTRLIELELINAFKLKGFRKEINNDDFQNICRRLKDHEEKGVYYRPQLDWFVVFSNTLELSKNHTSKIGSRSLDILHVATALFLKADKLLTFDDRQGQLARLAGLNIETIQ